MLQSPEKKAAISLLPVSQSFPFSWIPWLTAIGGMFLVFAVLTWLMLTHADVQAFDQLCKDTMKAHAQNHGGVRNFFWLVTWLGGVVGLTLLATVGTVTMFLRKEYLLAGIWVLATAGGALLNLGVKHSVNNPRPLQTDRDPSVAWITNPSFPSGHAMGSAIGLGMCLVVALRFLKKKRSRILISAAVILLILLIGFSRIYLRAHWFTDVVGGFTLAAAWLVCCLALLNRIEMSLAQTPALAKAVVGPEVPPVALVPGAPDS
jgi:undecaprenyl-diphosphatase